MFFEGSSLRRALCGLGMGGGRDPGPLATNLAVCRFLRPSGGSVAGEKVKGNGAIPASPLGVPRGQWRRYGFVGMRVVGDTCFTPGEEGCRVWVWETTERAPRRFTGERAKGGVKWLEKLRK